MPSPSRTLGRMLPLETLTTAAWVALVVGAVLVGFSKTAIGGMSMIAVGIYAAVLPARASTGVLLLLLIVGDVYAIAAYRRHADWAVLRKLAPAVVVGVVLGAFFVARVSDVAMKRTIGWILLLLIAVHVWTRYVAPRRRAAKVGAASTDEESTAHRVEGTLVTAGAGGMAGFTSMVANAGGAVMTLYMLRAGMTMMTFLGTGAWFFFLVNVFKVPFSIAVGVLTLDSLPVVGLMLPAVLVGAWIGRRVIGHISPAVFEVLVLTFTALAALNLVR